MRTVLYHAGRTAEQSGNVEFSEFFHRIASRGSKQKAVIATTHKILRVLYKTLELHYEQTSVSDLTKKGYRIEPQTHYDS